MFLNGQVKTSVLDHIYTADPSLIDDIESKWPVFTDHALIMFTTSSTKSEPNVELRRDWRNYSKEGLCQILAQRNWDFNSDSVQAYWNQFENQLVAVVDELVPLVQHRNSNITAPVPACIKNKINERKRLLRSNRQYVNTERTDRIKRLNKDIKNHFNTKMKKNVRRSIVPGNTQSLWRAVKVAKDTNTNELPNAMYRDGTLIEKNDLSENFAYFFDKNIQDLLLDTNINQSVYNGTQKVQTVESMFMDPTSVKEILRSLKIKNTEGFDRIPQRILVDGADILGDSLVGLFERIYHQKAVPGQWLVSKTIPVFKNKGNKSDIKNYRPISL